MALLGAFLFVGGKAIESAPLAATASVSPNVQYLNDTAGTTFTFTVNNTGTSGIGTVRITTAFKQPSFFGGFLGALLADLLEPLSCPQGPAGWNIIALHNSCTYYSNPGSSADNIAPGASSSAFKVTAKSPPGTTDQTANWRVEVALDGGFGGPAFTDAGASATNSLQLKLHVWEITDAVVAEETAAVNGACPPAQKQAEGGSPIVVIICGRNHASTGLTPATGAFTSLAGTFIGSSGTFGSGSISANSGNVVLGNWSGAMPAGTSGPGLTVIAAIGSAANQTSPLTTLSGYEVLNQPPVAAAAGPITTLEDTTSSPATGLSATDADGDTMTFSFSTASAHGTTALVSGSCSGTIPKTCTASVDYTPEADYFGPDSFAYIATDSHGAPSAPVTISVTVTPVNDEPSFSKGPDQTVAEDAGAQSVPGWVAASSAGPNETQTLTYVLSNDNNPLFSTQPAVSSTGTLTYTPAANANGTAIVTIHVEDDGGTANGGDNASPTQTFNITVTAVNDAPSFTVGPTVTVLEDSGPYSAAWATGISAGPGETQTLTFNVTGNTNAGLFSTAPAISDTGTLSFTPAANANGSATITITLSDNGGGTNTSAPQDFIINVTSVNDAPAGTSKDISAVEDTDYTLTATDFGFSDPNDTPANAFLAVKIGTLTMPTGAELRLSGTALTGGESVSVTDINGGLLKFHPATGGNGDDYAGFGFQVQDDGGTANGGVDLDASANTITFDVGAVNSAPQGTDNSTLSTSEDTPLTIVAADFGFSDPNDTPANNFLAVKIGSLPGWGTLTNDGTPVAAGDFVPVTDIDNNLFVFTPSPDYFGVVANNEFSFQVQDDGGTANSGVDLDPTANTITIGVNAVNDAPSFSPATLPDQTVAEDSGAQSVSSFTTAMSAGPSNESSQVLHFNVSNNNNPLFSTQPAIDASTGALTYTPAANAFGAATVSVTLQDDGGTANGGVDTTSPARTFTITVTAVNDVPSFTAGPDVTTPNQDSNGPTVYSAAWATAISAGPNEGGQVVHFEITDNTNTSLFTAGPAVSATGVLSFTADANTTGEATITLRIVDDGGTANGGVDTSATQSFKITTTSPPPVANDDGPSADYTANGGIPIDISAALGVLDNDEVYVGDTILSYGASTGSEETTIGDETATANGGTVKLFADGSFHYVAPSIPPVGGTDSFKYILTGNGGTSAAATVTINVSGQAFFINAGAAAGGNGSLEHPFNSLTQLPGTRNDNGLIFIYAGSYTRSDADGVTLKTGEYLIGQGVAVSSNLPFTLAPHAVSLPVSGTAPDLNTTFGGGRVVVLGSGNTVKGLVAKSGPGFGIFGSSFGTLTIASVTVDNASGGGISLQTGTVSSATLDTVNAGGGANGINLNSVGGSLAITNGTLQAASGAEVAITDSTLAFSYGGAVSKTSDGRLIDIDNYDTGTAAFSGNLSCITSCDGIEVTNSNGTINFSGGTKTLNTSASPATNAVELNGNLGGHINFTGGGLVITGGGTLATKTFNGTGGGTITVTGTGNSITTTGARALNLDSTTASTGVTIGDAGMTFATINVTTGQIGIYINKVDQTASSTGIDILGGSIAVDQVNGESIRFETGSVDLTLAANLSSSGSAIHTIGLGGAGRAGATQQIVFSGSIDENRQGISLDNNDQDGTPASITFSGSVDIDTIAGSTGFASSNGGNVTVTGQMSIDALTTGLGVSLTGNTGSTMTFNSGGNGLDIVTASGNGFNATGGGTVAVLGTSNTIVTTTGIALNVANTTIAATDLTFVSITAGTASGSAGVGINLNTTGALGGLHVTGNGTAGSGGTIQHKTGADGSTTDGIGIFLNSTADVQLNRMQLNDFDNSAITGRSVTGFTLNDSVLNGVIGTNSAPTEGAINFGVSNPSGTNGLQGTGVIHNTKVSGSIEHQLEFYNQSGSMNLTIDGTSAVGASSADCEIKDNSVASGSDGILIEMQGTSTATVLIQRCYFDDNKSQAVQAAANESSSIDITIDASKAVRTTQGNEGFVLSNGGNGDLTAHVTNNTISGFGGVAIFVGQTAGNATASSNLIAVIKNNTISAPTTATNHSIIAFLTSTVGEVSQANILIDGNNINQPSTSGTARPILVDTPDANTTPNFTARVINNVVTGVDATTGSSADVTARRGTGCFDVRNNSVAGAWGLRVRQAAPGTVNLEQGSSAGTAAVVLAANNAGTPVTSVLGTVTVVANGTCMAAPQ